MIYQAARIAARAHKSQFRKYPGPDGRLCPFIEHPARVASYLMTHPPRLPDEVIAAAWLHDVLEDTDFDPVVLEELFGNWVLSLVHEMTKRPSQKKADYIRSFATASNQAKLIKAADRIDNLRDSLFAPREFRKNFLEGSATLLSCLESSLDEDFYRDYVGAMEALEKSLEEPVLVIARGN